MNDLIVTFKNHYLFYILIVGLVAGFLANSQSQKPKTLKQKATHFLTGAISSTFLCWMSYEIAFYITTAQNASLAIGGFFAWRGANWATLIVDRWIDSKIGTN